MPQPVRLPIAVDAMGGDHAPGEVVAGAVAAVREHGLPILLVGPASEVTPLLARHEAGGRIPVVAAEEALSMDAGALTSWRRPRSSVAVACQLIHRGQAAALVSAGSTGGIVATARLRLRALPGVLRPAVAAVLPTRPRPTVLLDVGATADPKPEMVVQFAQLGVAYAQIAHGVEVPRVGLLTIGAEPGKGNKLARRVHELLDVAPLDFTGNVEGGDLFTGVADVVVTDGFTGNVALKTLEGAVRFTAEEIRGALTGSAGARVGAFLQRRSLGRLRDRLDADNHGGAALLGLNATVVIAHGSARARAVTAACRQAAALVDGQIVTRMRERVGSLKPPARFHRRAAETP